MTKNVLFLVAGMTPQIITETLWALACDPENAEQWVPSEIYVMSTGDGLKKFANICLIRVILKNYWMIINWKMCILMKSVYMPFKIRLEKI